MKFIKSKLNIAFVLLMTGLVPVIAPAQPGSAPTPVETKAVPQPAASLALADDAPSSYIVVKGDTLWDISGKFLKQPWRWPEIWNMNREQIKNPHWIYPGDIIKMNFDASGKPRLSLESGVGNTVKLSPQIRSEKLSAAIPSIPASVIKPFLSLPLVVEADGLKDAPRIVSTEDSRVVIGAGNTAYAVGMDSSLGSKWQVYRPGKALVDTESKELLGYEAIYLGDASVTKFGEASSIEILRSTQEINRGDRLTPTADARVPSYSPHAPEGTVQGNVISITSGVSEAAQYSIVVINRGKRNGMEIGHILATHLKGETVSTNTDGLSGFAGITNSSGEKNIPAQIKLPDERNGLLFIFRVFEKVSYALVMQSRRSLRVGDVVTNP